jgi:hypothetical protein
MSSGALTEKAVPIRMPSQALLCVDSADGESFDKRTGMRISASTPSDILINKQRPLLFGYMTRMSLTEVNLQWDIPNVNTTNNTMSVALWNAAGVLQSCVRVSVSPDFYTLPGICERLVDRLNADASDGGTKNYVITIAGENVKSGLSGETVYIVRPRVQITLGGGSTGFFSIIPYNATVVVNGAGVAIPTNLPPLEDDLTNMLGLTPTQSSALPYYENITGGYASAQYTPYIDIESNLLTKNQNVADGTSQMRAGPSKLARLYLAPSEPTPRVITIVYGAGGVYDSSTDNAFGTSAFVLHREFATPKIISWNTTENIDVVDLQVRDYRGNLVPVEPNITALGSTRTIGNTADFQFTIMSSEQ